MRNHAPCLFAAALLLLPVLSFASAGAHRRQQQTAPPPNLVADGDFERAPSWLKQTPGVTRPTEEGRTFLRFANAGADKAVSITHSVRLPAGGRFVVVGANLRVRDLKLGKEDWHEPRIALRFLNDAGEMVGGYPAMPNLRAEADWTRREVALDVPEGATQLQMQPGLWLATGTFDVDDLTVAAYRDRGTFVTATTPPPPAADVPAPKEVQEWGQEAVAALSPRRASLSLDGVWKFQPAVGEKAAREPEKVGWGYARVPGDWKRKEVLFAPGTGGGWQGLKPDELPAAWYERRVRIPADWAGRAVLVDLRRVSTDAVVYVDGKEAGRVVWPSGTVDVTPFVEAGREATLRVRVIATDDAKEVVRYMGFDQVTREPAKLNTRGLIGRVTLLSRPKGPHVADVFVRPSTRRRSLTLQVEVAGVREAGEATFTATLRDPKGGAAAEKTFTKAVPLAAGDSQTVTLEFPWEDPRLWDLAQPNLYALELSARGAGLDDAYPQTFGFREFWIDGKKFYLNGTEIRLRPNMINTGSANGGAVNSAKKLLDAGYNFGEYWPDDIGRRGTWADVDPIYEDADRVGLPVSANALSMPPFIFGPQWDDPARRAATKAEYKRHLETELRRIRNHPSVILYGTSANSFGNGQDQNPRFVGRADYISVQEYAVNRAKAQECIDLIKAFDPTRPVFTHHGGYYGDIHTCNHYLCLTPLQEREEWLSEWAKSGTLPYSAIEFGTPLYQTFLRGRDGYGFGGTTEPLMTEYCAVYLGNRAYRTEPQDYRARIAATFRGEQKYDSWFQFGDKSLIRAPAFQELQSLFIRNTWRSWRTWGITGGMLPWENGHDSPAVAENNGPTLAWIAGPAAAFTDKGHGYAAGERVEKQVVLVNDHRTPQPYAVTVEASVGGKALPRREFRGTLAPAQNLFLPVAFAAPTVAAKTPGVISLTARVGDREHKDAFAFRVWPRREPAAAAKAAPATLHVFDPAGETTALLKSLGYAVTPVRAGGALPKPGQTLVVGRRALSGRNLVPGDLAAFVRGGGRVLVMAQDPEWMRLSLHWRVAPHVARRAFAVGAGGVAAGLDDEDLRDWRGAGSLVEPYPHFPGYDWTPRYGWRWGTRGSVSSAPVEKPHRGSWRPLLECEFDLAYTPLMEMEYGRGRVTLCTLDLEDQAKADPAARRLARNLLARASAAPIAPKAARALYLGGDAGAKLLDGLGVKYERAGAPAPGALVLVGEGFGADDPRLAAFLSAGGRALFLPRRAEGPVAFGVRVERRAGFGGSLNPPDWAEARGLSASDLRWRASADALLLSGEGATIGADGLLARKTVGKGTALFCQIDPASLPADEKTYFRFTRWRQTRALCQVLANLGASFAQDDRTLALLARPDQGYPLAGTWQARLTTPVPEAPARVPHGDTGMSALAKSLVAADAPGDGFTPVPVPAYQESYGGAWKWTDGEAVFRKEVTIPGYLAGRDLYLSVGRVDETDETFFNGEKVGGSSHWLHPRGYKVPGRLVKPGRNVVAIRTWDQMIHGGLCPDPSQLFLRVDAPSPGFYHDDYRDDYRPEDWPLADNPYRYYRW